MTTGNRIWMGFVVLLVAMNIALLATIWLRPQHPQPFPQPRGVMHPPGAPMGGREMMNQLQLTDEQKAAFDQERAIHQKRIDSLKNIARNTRERYFGSLTGSGGAPNDSLAMALGTYHMLIEQQTFRHFATVRSMLNNDQKKTFDSSIMLIIKSLPEQPHFRGDGSRPPIPPRGGFTPPPGDCEDCPPPPPMGAEPRP